MAKQQDRFERAVQNRTHYASAEVLRLLRREHAAVVRAVEKMDRRELMNMSYDFQAGMHYAYCTVLALLARREGY